MLGDICVILYTAKVLMLGDICVALRWRNGWSSSFLDIAL